MTGVDSSAVAIDRARNLADAAHVAEKWRCDDVVAFEAEQHSFDLELHRYLHLPAEQMAVVLSHAALSLAAGEILCFVGHARVNLAEGIGEPQDPDVL